MEGSAAGPVVLGSAALPWPVPGCRCPACRADAGRSRGPSGLRVGGVTLDGAEPRSPHAGQVPAEPVAAEPALAGPLLAPPPDGVRVTTAGGGALSAGRGVTAGDGVRIGALPAGAADGRPDPTRSVLVVGHQGRTMVWAPDTGPLPEVTLQALAGGAAVLAALDVRDARGVPDPRRVAADLSRLEAVGALAPGARVVAVGLTHDVAPQSLAARLARWGVDLVADGAALDLTPGPGRRVLPWRTLVLGESASGKSQVAEDLLAAQPEVTYIATGPIPDGQDLEWAARVQTHRRGRPASWGTRETVDLAAVLAEPGAPVLVDSLGTWAGAALQGAGAWDDAEDWESSWQREVTDVVAAWRQTRRPVVAVGELVGGGVVAVTPAGRRFQAALGELIRRLAQESELVLLVVAGRAIEVPPGSGAHLRMHGV